MRFDKQVEELQELGLSEKEAQVYMAALSLGPTSVQNIAKKSGVNRVTTYVMIEQLTQMGLMSSHIKGKKKLFSAEKPDRLLTLIHEKEKELQAKEHHFRTILPALKAIARKSSNKTSIRLYEGIEGLKAVHELLYAAFSAGEFDEYIETILPEETRLAFRPGDSPARDKVREIIKQKKIKANRLIIASQSYIENIGVKDVKAYDEDERKYVRILNRDAFHFKNEIGIYGSYTVFWIVVDMYEAIVIHDAEIAESMRVLLRGSWVMSSTVDEIIEKYG